MSKLAELQKKYPSAQYEPLNGHAKCGGNGEFYFQGEILGGWKPCACIFIDHEFLPIFGETMNATIKSIREDMNKHAQ